MDSFEFYRHYFSKINSLGFEYPFYGTGRSLVPAASADLGSRFADPALYAYNQVYLTSFLSVVKSCQFW